MAKLMYRITYFDVKDGLHKYYMRTLFATIKQAKNEMRLITKERISSKKWFDRREWAIASFNPKTKETKQFGVGGSAIYHIISNQTWKHLTKIENHGA